MESCISEKNSSVKFYISTKRCFSRNYVVLILDALTVNKENTAQVPVNSIDSSCSDDSANKQTRESGLGDVISEPEDGSSKRDVAKVLSTNKTSVASHKKGPAKKTVKPQESSKKEKSVQTIRNDSKPKPNLYPEITKSDVILMFYKAR